MKKLICLALAICMLFSLVACGQAETEGPDSSDPLVIKLTTTNSSSNPEVKAIAEACERIKDRTDSMVDIQLYPDGQMMVYSEGIEAVMSNSAVIYFTACNLFSDYVPEFTTVYLPYLYNTTDICVEFMESDVWQQISDKANDTGLHVFANIYCNGYRNTFADKPVNSAADLEGMSIRVPDSTLYIDTFAALKTNYMPMAFSEVYSALQTGMLNGVEGVSATIANYSLYETMDQSYYSTTHHILDNAGFFVGYDFWMSIPEEYRTIIEDEFWQAGIEGNAANAELDAEFVQTLQDNGVEIVEIEDYSTFKDAVADLVTSSPMGREVLDQIAEIEQAN